MRTYELLLKIWLPFLPAHKVLNRKVGIYGSLNPRCNLKKRGHFAVIKFVEVFRSGRWQVEIKDTLAEFELTVLRRDSARCQPCVVFQILQKASQSMQRSPIVLHSSHLPLGAIMQLPRPDSDSHMGSLPPAKRKHTFGMLVTLSTESERSGFRTHASFSPKSEDESGKHALYSTVPENSFCMNIPLPRASTGFRHAGDALPIARVLAGFWHVGDTLPVARASTGFRLVGNALPISRGEA